MKKILPLLLLAGTGIYLYVQQAKKFLKNIRFAFIDVKLDWTKSLASGLSKIFLVFKIDIINTTNFEGKLLLVHLDVIYQGNKVATIESNNSVAFSKQATTHTTIPVVINVANIVTRSKKLINDIQTGSPISLTYKGYADVTAGRININETRQLNV
jgi:hypothetical protein